MFNLDQAIAEWRRQMSAAGISSPEVLDELESHLREDVERQTRSGATHEEAFRKAVQQLGVVENLQREFAKVRPADARLSHKAMSACCLACAAFVLVVGTGTLLLYDLTVPARVFGISVVVLISASIGALPDLKRLLWPSARGRALLKAINSVCGCAVLVWVCLLFASQSFVDVVSLKMVVDVVTWGLAAFAAMTVFAFTCGREPEALDLWTPAVWQSFELASAEAVRFRHDFIGTEHVLLGLLDEENGTVRILLERFGIGREAVRAEIEKIVGAGPHSSTAHPPAYTPRAQRAFEIAVREAKAERAVRARTEHVLLGLLEEGSGVAAVVLGKMGVTAAKVREQLRSNKGDDHA